MIFETTNKDLILIVSRILEVEKIDNFNTNKPVSGKRLYCLGILTIDNLKKIYYDNLEKRDEDYNKIKDLLKQREDYDY